MAARPWLLLGALGLGGCVADTAGLEALGALDVVPAAIEFGTLGGGCGPFERPVVIVNASDAEVIVQRIDLRDGVAFQIAALPPPLPQDRLRMAPGERVEVSIRFEATVDGDYADVLQVIGEVAGVGFMETVALSGRVAADGLRTENFTQAESSDADILFVVDSSCSMVAEQDALTRNFRSFIEIADSGLLNYQIAVTTTDVSETRVSELGRIVPLDADPGDRIVTRATLPSPSERFRRNAAVGARDNTLVEQGLEAARLALSPELLEDHNFGFIRDQALLSVIFISDEFDQSPAEDVDVYVDALLAVKGGDLSKVTVSAVVGDPPRGCDGPSGPATEAPRYTEMASRLGGVIESICTSDWSEVMSRLSSTAFGLRARFPLIERPGDPETIEVRVDGAVVEPRDALMRDRWRYQPGSNSIVFSSRSIPGPGAAIQIQYETSCGNPD